MLPVHRVTFISCQLVLKSNPSAPLEASKIRLSSPQHIIRMFSNIFQTTTTVTSLLQHYKFGMHNDLVSIAVFFIRRCLSWSLLCTMWYFCGRGVYRHPYRRGHSVFNSTALYITDLTQLSDMSSNSTDSLDLLAQDIIAQLPAAYAFRLSLRTIADFIPVLLAGILHFLLQVISIRFIRVRFIKW